MKKPALRAVALAAAVAAVWTLPGALHAQTASFPEPDLIGTVDDSGIILQHRDGREVIHLHGQHEPWVIEIRDRSSRHNFHLYGTGGVNEQTGISETETVTWTLALPDGEYWYACAAPGHNEGGFFYVHDTPPPPGPPPPPPPGPPPPGPPPPPAPPPPSPRADQPDLIATVGPGARIELFHGDGREVKTLTPGTYTMQVHDFSQGHNFHLTGRGVNQSTPVDEIVHPVWTLTFGAGTYSFRCDAHATTMRGTFTVGAPRSPPRTCRVPTAVGKTLAVARRAIRRAGCAVGRVRYSRSARPRGRVVRQTPRAGARVRRGSRVHLVVSRGRR